MGNVRNYLGIQATRNQEGQFSVFQIDYINKIAKEFKLEQTKGSKYPLDPGYHKLTDENFVESNNDYRKLIGMLLYDEKPRPDPSVPKL